MKELFAIKIVLEDDNEILLGNLTDIETIKILGRAYDSILNEELEIKFTDDIKVQALELKCFYIQSDSQWLSENN